MKKVVLQLGDLAADQGDNDRVPVLNGNVEYRLTDLVAQVQVCAGRQQMFRDALVTKLQSAHTYGLSPTQYYGMI